MRRKLAVDLIARGKDRPCHSVRGQFTILAHLFEVADLHTHGLCHFLHESARALVQGVQFIALQYARGQCLPELQDRTLSSARVCTREGKPLRDDFRKPRGFVQRQPRRLTCTGNLIKEIARRRVRAASIVRHIEDLIFHGTTPHLIVLVNDAQLVVEVHCLIGGIFDGGSAKGNAHGRRHFAQRTHKSARRAIEFLHSGRHATDRPVCATCAVPQTIDEVICPPQTA